MKNENFKEHILPDARTALNRLYTCSISTERTDIANLYICMQVADLKNYDYNTLLNISGFGSSFAYEPRDKNGVSFSVPGGGIR